MEDLEPTAAAISYRCSSCSRCFIALGEEAAGEILCPCGAPLQRSRLPRGIYEMRSPVAVDFGSTIRDRQQSTEAEQDLGYGASHGNDPAHSGPTGPGDAPADVTGGAPKARSVARHDDNHQGST